MSASKVDPSIAQPKMWRPRPAQRGRRFPVIETTVMNVLNAAGLEAPRPNEIAAAHRMAEPGVLAALHGLVKRRVVVKVKADYFVAAEVLDALRTRMRAHFLSLSPNSHPHIGKRWLRSAENFQFR